MEKVFIYTFKVKLKFAKRIWRRIEIRSDQTLEDLHDIIFTAFDRYDEHLYAFYNTQNPNSISRDRLYNVPKYTDSSGVGHFSPNIFDASKTLLLSLNLKEKNTLEYLFDFGDEWWHILELEKISELKQAGVKYPKIIEKKGESPDQYPDHSDYDE